MPGITAPTASCGEPAVGAGLVQAVSLCNATAQEVWGDPVFFPAVLAGHSAHLALVLQSEPCMLAQGASGLQTT